MKSFSCKIDFLSSCVIKGGQISNSIFGVISVLSVTGAVSVVPYIPVSSVIVSHSQSHGSTPNIQIYLLVDYTTNISPDEQPYEL